AAAFAQLSDQHVVGRGEEPDRRAALFRLRGHRTGVAVLLAIQAEHHRAVAFQGLPEFFFEFAGIGHLGAPVGGESGFKHRPGDSHVGAGAAVHPAPTAADGCSPPHHRRDMASMNPDLVGWAASAILLATLSRQIITQWRDKDAKGVSRWLFAGQIAASIGFIVYSWMLDNWVFIVTNSLILLTAVVGQVGLLLRRRQAGA